MAKNADFKRSCDHFFCYENIMGQLADWNSSGLCPNTSKYEVHKGHMIAARYGIGNAKRIKDTFTLTNAVPQERDFNSNKWMRAEGSLIQWAKNCQNIAPTATIEARIYIVVGVIPTSFYGTLKTKFFGSAGFSNFQGDSKIFPGLWVIEFWFQRSCGQPHAVCILIIPSLVHMHSGGTTTRAQHK
jgi:hypothetical protein